MSTKLGRIGVGLAVCVLFALTAGPSVGVDSSYTGHVGEPGYGPWTVIATVSTTATIIDGQSWYKFNYEVQFLATTKRLNKFEVANPFALEYRDANNSEVANGYFLHQPTWSVGQPLITWQILNPPEANMPQRTVNFWYYARTTDYAVNLTGAGMSGGGVGQGDTLVMALPTPEPASVTVLAAGLLGTMGGLLRRARLRRK